MKLKELREELLARGFDYLTEARANRFLNDGYLVDVCEETEWPFLEASKEGAAPLEISDLRTIEYVQDVTNEEKLRPLIRRRVTDDFNIDLTETGTPEVYYLTEGKKVNVFPVATNTLLVRYWKVPEELSTDEKKPLLPERFHDLIVDAAVARAYRDKDGFEAATAAEEVFQRNLARAETSLLNLQHDAPDDHIEIEDGFALLQ